MRIIQTKFDFNQLDKIYNQILTVFNIEDGTTKLRVFGILSKYEGVSNTLNVRHKINKSINKCLGRSNDNYNENENNKIEKIIRELLN